MIAIVKRIKFQTNVITSRKTKVSPTTPTKTKQIIHSFIHGSILYFWKNTRTHDWSIHWFLPRTKRRHSHLQHKPKLTTCFQFLPLSYWYGPETLAKLAKGSLAHFLHNLALFKRMFVNLKCPGLVTKPMLEKPVSLWRGYKDWLVFNPYYTPKKLTWRKRQSLNRRYICKSLIFPLLC